MQYDLQPGCYTGQTFAVSTEAPLILKGAGIYAFQSCKFQINANTPVGNKLIAVRAEGVDMLRLAGCEIDITGLHVGKLYAVELVRGGLLVAQSCVVRAKDMGAARLIQATLSRGAVFRNMDAIIESPQSGQGRDLKVFGTVACGPSSFEELRLANEGDGKSAISLVRATGYIDNAGDPQCQAPVFVGRLRYSGLKPLKLLEIGQNPPVEVVRQ